MAPQLRIHLTGNASVSRKAERGVLQIRIKHTSPSQANASSAVASKSDALTTLFRRHAPKTEHNHPDPNTPITSFTLAAPSSSSHVPPSTFTGQTFSDGPRQYTTETTAEIVFRDLALLGELAVELSAMEDVAIEQTEWRLTDATRDEIAREARIGAVRNAVEKANDYAGVVNREVVAFQINDGQVNMSSTSVRQMRRYGQPLFRSSGGLFGEKPGVATEDVGGPSLEAATITVSASVNVNFVSKDGEAMADVN